MTIDVVATFSTPHRARQESFERLRDFSIRWRGIVPERSRPASVEPALARIGTRLPAALVEAWSELGTPESILSGQDSFLDPGQWRVEDGAVVVRWENQSCASWGIRVADAGMDDPPVVVRLDHAWEPCFESVSAFVIDCVFSEATMRAALADNGDLGDLEQDAGVIGEPLVPLAVPPSRHWALRASDGPSRWYGFEVSFASTGACGSTRLRFRAPRSTCCARPCPPDG
jgi:hypothetical protein